MIIGAAIWLWSCQGIGTAGGMASPAPGANGAGRLCDTLSGPGNRTAQGKRRRLDRRNTEEAVERAITEHLGDTSVLTTSVMKVDGISLKERQSSC